MAMGFHGKTRVIFGTIDAGAYEYGEMFVATNGNNASDGREWASAKQTIQSAIDAAEAGMVIWVSNGVYNAGSVASPIGTASNRIAITKMIRVNMAAAEHTVRFSSAA